MTPHAVRYEQAAGLQVVRAKALLEATLTDASLLGEIVDRASAGDLRARKEWRRLLQAVRLRSFVGPDRCRGADGGSWGCWADAALQ